MVSSAPKEMFKGRLQKSNPPSRHHPHSSPIPPHEDKAPCLWPPQGEKRPTTWRKSPHNVKKNPHGKKFPEIGERLLLPPPPPPPERPCVGLLQYYNNAREISSSPPTPHPHNEIVIF